ncbi:MAG: hypothetical protein JO260_01910 [Acidobacteria bacterium]|nr:hypothetical protein [Acidobacteriota bacterium]
MCQLNGASPEPEICPRAGIQEIFHGIDFMTSKIFTAFLLYFFCWSLARAQENVPIISGGAGFLSSTQGGTNVLQPVLAPVLAAPLGDRWLIESRADLRIVDFQQGPGGSYQNESFTTLEYLQLDYNANSHLTITAGRFLTPFNIYNERISPIWISKLQDAPYVAAIGTGQGYSDGMMLRGALIATSRYAVNYEAYFSTLSTVNKFTSERGTGGRVSVFVPSTRLELGASYRKTLQGMRSNAEGVDLTWEPYQAPLQLRGEWAHSASGFGYWIQASYRWSQMRSETSALGRLEPVFRMQQFFRSEVVPNDSLPTTNAQQPTFGLNYYLPHEIRLIKRISCGR